MPRKSIAALVSLPYASRDPTILADFYLLFLFTFSIRKSLEAYHDSSSNAGFGCDDHHLHAVDREKDGS